MLNNPDVAPSASVDWWIISIQTFHFELRHIPGKHHRPNGLSHRPPQPEDNSNNEESKEEAEEFEDWIDDLYSFAHMINPLVVAPNSEQLVHILASEHTYSHLYKAPNAQEDKPNYNIIPQSAAAVQANK
jgi:hypothetical protein